MHFIDPIPPELPEAPLEPMRPQPAENPPFNLMDVLWIVAAAIVALFVCTSIVVAVISVSRPRHHDIKDLAGNVLLLLPAQVMSYVLTVGFMAVLIWHKYRIRLLEAVRWNLPPARISWLAFAGGAGVGLATQLLSSLLERWIPKSLPVEQYFRTPEAAYALAAFGILVAPAVEELFFRGFLYPALARPLGMAPAVALTAGAFALIHSEQLGHAWVPLLLLALVGAVLTLVRAKTKSVAVCVVMHMGYNSALFVLLYVATQGFRHMERAA